MKVLFDTNVIIDAMQSRTPWSADAQKLFLKVAANEINGCITANAVTDIHYLMHKYLHDEARTRKVLEKLFELFEILDTTDADCRSALFSSTTDYEDAVMIETAVRSGVDCIITRNKEDFNHSPVRVCTSAEFPA